MINQWIALPLRRGRHPAAIPWHLWFSCLVLGCVLALAPLTWLLMALAAAVSIILVLIYPWLAWIVFAFALPVASGLRLGPASPTDLLFAAACALWAAASIASVGAARHRPGAHTRIPLWTVGVYLLALYLSSLAAADLGEALTEMVKWVEFGALLWVVPLAVPGSRVQWLVAALLAAAAVQGIYGLYQFIFRIGPEWFLIQGRFMRASGVFGQPNPFGAYMGLSLPVALSLGLWSAMTLLRTRTWASLGWTIFYAGVAACIGVGLVASWSRGAWFGALAAVVVVMGFFNRSTAAMLGMGVLALLTAFLLGALNPAWIPPAVAARLSDLPAYLGLVDVLTLEVNDDNFAVIERVAHWVAALRMWQLSPWLGVGPGNYATAYAAVALPRWREPLGHAHNIYLNVLGESGLVGLAAFLLMWSSLITWLVRRVQVILPPQSWERALAIGVLGMLAHLAVHSIFDNLFVQGMYLHIALWLATVAAAAISGTAFKVSSSAQSAESDG